MYHLIALLIGFFVDLLLGDPHSIPHPVVWIGKLISAAEKLVRRMFPKTVRGENIAGGVLWVIVVLVSTAVPALLLYAAYRLHPAAGLVLESIMCWQILATRSLRDESMKVYAALKKGGAIIPVDSEQSAIFQCMAAGNHGEIQRLILTASGGPFREYTKEQLKTVTPEQAGHHPTWKMGRKITIDSASFFNKGLEIMEASYLFGIPGERISVLVHPESIVHSMVEYTDGCNMAQLSRPDMRLAIQYALTYPERTPGEFGRLRLEDMGKISFYAPDTDKFPAIPMAYEALREGRNLPIVYNGANEAAVDMFIRGKIRFDEIADVVGYAMSRADSGNILSLEDIIKTDRQARKLAFEKGNA